MHQALYRKWRPRTFDEVHGQEHITSVLKYEVANNKFSHAYLFCGSRGTGKTSCAKILAKAVNCLSPKDGSPCGECEACRSIDSGAATDVLEMDAASNNGVDNIRDIRDEVVYSPSSLKYRVYIIDEVHMLSTSAFNALLKTLEEPPEHAVFILATTELHKLPATIISRCQRFDFRRISSEILKNHLLRISRVENIKIEEGAAFLLAKAAQGGMRDAISLLDLCAGNREKIDEALVNRAIGSGGREETVTVVKAIADRDYETIFKSIDDVVQSSRDIAVFWQDLISIYRDLLIIKTSKNASAYLDLTDSETESLSRIASLFTIERLSYHCSMLEEGAQSIAKSNAIKRISAELTLVKMCDERLSTSPEAMLSRISALENSGVVRLAEPAEAVQTDGEKSIPAGKKPSRRPKYVDDDDEMFRSDSPIAKPVSKTTPSANEKSATGRVLKPFKSRAEVSERLISTEPMTGAFFKAAKWYNDESGNVVIKFTSQSELDIVKQFGGDKSFIMAVSSVTGRSLALSNLSLEIEGSVKEDEIIDSIISAAESD